MKIPEYPLFSTISETRDKGVEGKARRIPLIPLIWVEESIGKSESVDIVAIAPYSLVVQMVENKGIGGGGNSSIL